MDMKIVNVTLSKSLTLEQRRESYEELLLIEEQMQSDEVTPAQRKAYYEELLEHERAIYKLLLRERGHITPEIGDLQERSAHFRGCELSVGDRLPWEPPKEYKHEFPQRYTVGVRIWRCQCGETIAHLDEGWS